MGVYEAGTLVSVETPLKYHPGCAGYLTPSGGHWLAGSLTGAVASQSVTEARKGSLSLIGNQALVIRWFRVEGPSLNG